MTAGLAMADPSSPAVEPATARAGSYRTMLRTSALIGGSAVVTVCTGMVRTKLMAVLLGPAGYGLMAAYALIGDLARTVAQLGLNASGVRQIADAAASDDDARIARTAAALRDTSLLCGLLGAAALVALSGDVSRLTFGDDRQAGPIAWLSIAVFLSVVAGYQAALLQGMRRIADLARLAVVGSVLATVVGTPLVYVLGRDGIVPALIVVAASSVAVSWWYCRKLGLRRPPLRTAELVAESAALLRLGVAFLASALLTIGASYVVRIIVMREVGLDAAGVYAAAWTLGGLYIGYVLQALATDFYPRLVAVIGDDATANRLVNEQTQVSLLLAVPGVLFTIVLAPLVLSLFYSAEFAGAAAVLRWICLGMALRVLTWPIGFIVVARNRQMVLVATELAWTVVNVGLTWWCVRALGVDGAGIAFFASYVFHALMMYPVVRALSGFRWTAANGKTAATGFVAVGAVFAGFHVLPTGVATTFGLLVASASVYVSARRLVRLADPGHLPLRIARFLRLKVPAR